jgi:acyl-coenzyme A thioesterase PaaI-like protein
MSVRYLDTVRQEDLVAEGWVTKRGRKVVFCEVEVRTATAVKVATGHLLYIVADPPPTD